MLEACLLFLCVVGLVVSGSRLWTLVPWLTWPVSVGRRFLLLTLGASTLIGVLTYQLMNARTFQLLGTLINRVDTHQQVIALTFDDGPTSPYSEDIRVLLRDAGVQATFFVTGAELADHPELGAALVRDGHELGNHSYSHQRLIFQPLPVIQQEIEQTDQRIRQAGGTGPIHFRSPYGKKLLLLPYYLMRSGRTNIFWDIEPDSAPGVTAHQIVADVTAKAKPGSIVLLHVMGPSRTESRKAVPDIIATLRERGFRFVTVSELMATP